MLAAKDIIWDYHPEKYPENVKQFNEDRQSIEKEIQENEQAYNAAANATVFPYAATVSIDSTVLCKQPSENADTLVLLKQGAEVTVIEANNTYLKCDYKIDEWRILRGWVLIQNALKH